MRVLYKGKKEILKYGYGETTLEFFFGKEKTVPKDVGEILVTNCSSDFERVMQPEKDDADAVIDLDEEKEEIPEKSPILRMSASVGRNTRSRLITSTT